MISSSFFFFFFVVDTSVFIDGLCSQSVLSFWHCYCCCIPVLSIHWVWVIDNDDCSFRPVQSFDGGDSGQHLFRPNVFWRALPVQWFPDRLCLHQPLHQGTDTTEPGWEPLPLAVLFNYTECVACSSCVCMVSFVRVCGFCVCVPVHLCESRRINYVYMWSFEAPLLLPAKR